MRDSSARQATTEFGQSGFPHSLQELCTSWGESVIASPYAKASGLKALFKPRETCFLIGTKSVNLGIRPSNLAYGTRFARGKTGTDIAKKIKPRSSEECG
jgi:hypothetical protein